ncbi:thioredoxin-disulfide reductase [Evtepia sp.]|uniref:thioredoxin-disulfide reductase n=1 Tax=Evtepia sp. TaxID=2773933 RepID=UPI003F13F351
MKQLYDVIVIGGGPGGYTAALYCARAGLHTVILEKMMPGGQMALTEQIDNYPGFDQGVDGFTLGQQMKNGAERFGAETRTADVLSVKLEGEIKEVETTDGIVSGRVVILATGAATRELGLPGEKELVGRGVSYCATCDGMFFRGKTVVVVGGGNSAAADAMVLSRVCEKVILVHRRDTLRATKVYHKPLMEAENVAFRWNSTVTELLQEGRLTGVKVKDTITGEETVVPCDGLFVSIGRAPASELVKGVLELDEAGYVKADESTRTSIPGVFAVGDVRTKVLRQIITAAADGAVASHYADEYLASKN